MGDAVTTLSTVMTRVALWLNLLFYTLSFIWPLLYFNGGLKYFNYFVRDKITKVKIL